MVDLVVLSLDALLGEAIRHAVGARTAVWRAGSAEEAVDLLLSGRCGVLLVDMAAMSAEPASFVRQILEQFPDVVIVAAGAREDAPLLAGLISEGRVYRFMHKPISPRRARMFLDAAVRCHLGLRSGGAFEPRMPVGGRASSRVEPRKWLFVGGGLAMFVAVLVAMNLAPDAPEPAAPPSTPATPAAVVAAPSQPLADPVLARARAAFAAGRDEAPPGRNALDLYSAVLLARPEDAEAQSGLEATTARLVAKAEDAAGVGNLREARRLAARVLEASPRHAGARSLAARLDSPRPPAPEATRVAPTVPLPKPATPPAATRLPVEPAASRHGSATSSVRPAPTKFAPVATAPVVRPDPLAPVFIRRSGVIGPDFVASWRRSPGAPAHSGHPTAANVARHPVATVFASNPLVPMEATSNRERIDARDLQPLAMNLPAYPPHAFRARVEGWVEVEYTVTAQGRTGDIEVVGAAPRGVFEAAATEAVAGWRFRPRIVNGRPTPQRSAVTLRFSVED